jgi:NADH dehydrogenase
MTLEKLLILGGTGLVGRALCERWVRHDAGVRLTVPTRQWQRGKVVQFLPTVDIVQADVMDDQELARLVAGQDAVVNLVARLHGSEAEFRRLHVDLPERLARACRQAGVQRLVHVSALGADAAGPSMYQRSKAAGEAVLQQAGLDLTLLRPSVIFGEGDRFMNLFARLQARFPVMPLGRAHSRFQPVWVDDVAEAILQSLLQRDTIGKIYECTGPRTYTLAELVRLAGRWSGRPRPILPLPDSLAKLQAMLMQVLPGEPLLSRDNIDSMRVDNVATGTLPGLQALGIIPASLDSVMPELLARGAGPTRLDALRRAARR